MPLLARGELPIPSKCNKFVENAPRGSSPEKDCPTLVYASMFPKYILTTALGSSLSRHVGRDTARSF